MYLINFVAVLSILCLNCNFGVLGGQNDFKRVCYYTNWAQYRPGDGMYKPENIDPTLCTHIMYAFGKLVDGKILPFEWNDETADSKGMFERVTDLKKANKDLKVILSVGGWNAGTAEMTKMLATPQNRKAFIEQSIKYLRKWNFDGLDMDFEYPRGGDKQKMTALIQETRDAYTKESQTSGKPPMHLSIAIPAGKDNIDNAYELSKIKDNLDHIGIMSYDYHGAWDHVTGHNSPLNAKDNLALSWSADYVEKNGVEASKIVVGMALYGRCFTLANANNNGLGAPVSGPCPAGTYTREAGILSYYEICSTYLSNPQTKVQWSDELQSPYLVSGNIWVGYDDPKSLAKKLEFVKSKNYGGWMVWDLSFDDFNGKFCDSKVKYPLLSTLNSKAGANPNTKPATKPEEKPVQPPSKPVEPPKQPPTKPVETPKQPGNSVAGDCKQPGIFADPTSCSKYIQCANGNKYNFDCQAGLYFNPDNSTCDWASGLSAARKKQCGLK